MKDLLKNPEFAEALDMIHKQYIDQMYQNAGKQAPVPESLIPLSYADAKIQKGLNQLRQGARNALYAADKYLKEKTSE